jgi:hypothetical protein
MRLKRRFWCEEHRGRLLKRELHGSGRGTFNSRLEEIMSEATARRYRTPLISCLLAALIAIPLVVLAQGGRGGGAPAGAPAAGAPPAAGGAAASSSCSWTGAAAPAPRQVQRWSPSTLRDLVSIVTEDWIERMSPDSPRSGLLVEPRRGAVGAVWAVLPAVQQRWCAVPPPMRIPCNLTAGGTCAFPGRDSIFPAYENT